VTIKSSVAYFYLKCNSSI